MSAQHFAVQSDWGESGNVGSAVLRLSYYSYTHIHRRAPKPRKAYYLKL